MNESLTKKIRLNPLTILLINFFMPLINTIFPSSKCIFFNILISLFILCTFSFKKAFKAIIFLFSYFFIYYLVLVFLKNGFVISFFRMSYLFVSISVFCYILISFYTISEILSSLQKLKLPKVFIISLSVTLKYIKTFKIEFTMIKDAMNIRGIYFSFKKPFKSFEYFIVPILFRCLNLSTELTSAAICKGINYSKKRSNFFINKFSFFDFFVISILIFGYVLIIGDFI